MNPYRVLLVDDDVFFLKVYGEFLRSRGFEVETAGGGREAVALYQAGRYQLVVVDLIMPDLPGIEVIEKIRGLNPAQDVVVVTGTEDVRTAVRAMRLGVYDYLVKPIEREELMLVIDRLQERATLYDEHARLLHENIQHHEVQQIFQRGLRIMQSLDLESVCENLLGTLCDICGAQGAALWLGKDDGSELAMHGYRGLVEAGALPMAWNPVQTPVGGELARGWPVLARRDVTTLTRQTGPAEAMLVPLSREGRLIGLVYLADKLGGGFSGQDAAHAKLIGDCAVTAVSHARRFRHLERVGLRDPSTTAYNMTYFVDYLGRELHKARRYRRSFSLVQKMSIDNLATLKQSLTPEIYRETLRRLVLAVSGVLRDIDVLARVTDDEMYLLLPETDFLGGLGFARAARDSVKKSSFLVDIDRQHPIHISFGPAAFPRDGDDVDQLFGACRRRLDEARRSLFRRLHLEDVDFWGAVDLLIGDAAAYDKDLDSVRSLAVAEDEKGISRHNVFPAGFSSVVRQEVLGEAARQSRSSGWLFVGGSWPGNSDALVQRLAQLEGSALKTYLLAPQHPPSLSELGHVTKVRVDGDAFINHDIVLLLAEHAAYGLFGRRRADGRLFGFHTADWTLVEGLLGKLQDAYHLQRGAT